MLKSILPPPHKRLDLSTYYISCQNGVNSVFTLNKYGCNCVTGRARPPPDRDDGTSTLKQVMDDLTEPKQGEAKRRVIEEIINSTCSLSLFQTVVRSGFSR